MSTATESPRWITRTEAIARLGVGHRGLNRLIEQGLIGVRTFPGLPGPKFDRLDIDRLAAESVRPASREAVSSC